MRLENQTALVTGASAGIGRAIAVRLAEEGCDVAINYRHDRAAAEAVAEQVRALGRKAMTVEADVSKPAQVEAMVELVTGAWSSLDLLVNNAGVVRRGGLLDVDEHAWDEVVDVNMKGSFFCLQAAARWMLPRRKGAIVNIASMRGVEGGSSSPHYAAAKAGVIALTKTAARELAPHLRVNAVAPGYVDTRIQAGLSEEQRRAIEAGTPLGRFGVPEDVANAVVFLGSSEAAYVTGQTLLVDGGRVMC